MFPGVGLEIWAVIEKKTMKGGHHPHQTLAKNHRHHHHEEEPLVLLVIVISRKQIASCGCASLMLRVGISSRG